MGEPGRAIPSLARAAAGLATLLLLSLFLDHAHFNSAEGFYGRFCHSAVPAGSLALPSVSGWYFRTAAIGTLLLACAAVWGTATVAAAPDHGRRPVVRAAFVLGGVAMVAWPAVAMAVALGHDDPAFARESGSYLSLALAAATGLTLSALGVVGGRR